MRRNLLVAAFALFTSTAFAQESGGSLDAKCEAARQKQIDLVKRDKIVRCERSARQPAGGCDAYYRIYGDDPARSNVPVGRRRYDNLPECIQARQQRPQLGDIQAN